MNLMIDIETLGIDPKAPVISIGAVYFDEKQTYAQFYINVDAHHQIDSGLRKFDASTIKWWMNQEDAAKKVFKENAVPVKQALNAFRSFIAGSGGFENTKPWGNGSNFDITILESLFKDYELPIPWNFRNIRDLRTFKEYVYDGAKTKRVGTHHNAIDDALYQAQVVIDGLNKDELPPLPKDEVLKIQASMFIDGDEFTRFSDPTGFNALNDIYKFCPNLDTNEFVREDEEGRLFIRDEVEVSSYYNDKGRVFEYKIKKEEVNEN